MALCPNQHTVVDGEEYCDECGSRVTATIIPTPNGNNVSSSLSGGDMNDIWTCGDCGTSQGTSRFCEACGQPNQAHPEFVGSDVSNGDEDPTEEVIPHSEQTTEPPVTTLASGWVLKATADRGYFDRIMMGEGPDSAQLSFPAVYPPRQFTIDKAQVFIGRHSRRRGIDPDIDLSAAPADPGVSHTHAAIVSDGDALSIVDIGSANGTYLNNAEEPLPANTPIPLSEGDRIQLGAWTQLTVERG